MEIAGAGELIVAHLDHGLRGDESREDARYVQRLAANLGLAYVAEETNATYSTELRIPLEDWARRTRYAFLRRVAAEHHAERILTGRNATTRPRRFCCTGCAAADWRACGA